MQTDPLQPRFRIRRSLLTGLLVGALLGSAATLGVLQLTAALPSPPIESLHDPLSIIVGSFRLTEGRTAHQALYAPYPTPPAPRGQQELLRFLRGNVSLSPLSARQRASLAHKRATAHLFRGHPDAAIADLNSALETVPDDAELLSDLSALYNHRSFTQRRQPEDRLAALASSERAALLAPDAPEPRFNHALALEHLFLWEDARHAWSRYLVVDPRSPWAGEARRHLRTIDLALRTQGLAEPYVRIVEVIGQEDRKELLRLASLSPWEARRALEDILLSRWTSALAGGDIPKARQLLPGLQVLADLLARRTGDRIFQEITGAMADVLASPATQPRLETTLHPLLLYREALRRYAERDLRGAHSKLEDLGRNVLLAAYPSLDARRICLKGVLAQLEGRPQTALAAYLDAHRRAAAIGEESFAAWLDLLIAQSFESTGQPGPAWFHLERALAWTSTHPSRSQLMSTLDSVVLFSLRHSRPELALRFQDRLLSVAGTFDARGAVVSGRLRRARIEAVLGKTVEANLDLQRALAALPFVTHSIQHALLPEINAAREDIEKSHGRAVALGIGLRASIPLESLLPSSMLGQMVKSAGRSRFTPTV